MGEASCILWAAAGLDPAAGGMAASHHPSCTGHQQLSWITIGTVYSLSSHPNIILYGITWCMKVKERWVSKVCKELPYPACLVRERKKFREMCMIHWESCMCWDRGTWGGFFYPIWPLPNLKVRLICLCCAVFVILYIYNGTNVNGS